ncbi:MAG: hypothetical protein JWM97_3029, partial [Phycisphaerales bacterium]|nr:hypothetical protein [Phycisphaerales bacterium]
MRAQQTVQAEWAASFPKSSV